MNKRGAGVVCCAIGVFTLVSRYIVSAIYSQGVWESFWRLDNLISHDFLIFGFVFLGIGILYIFFEEIKSVGKIGRKKGDKYRNE